MQQPARELGPAQGGCAALVLTSPFVPMLFQGEEWGAPTPFLCFTNHQEAELGQTVRKGRLRDFAAYGWQPDAIPDPQARGTFQRSRLNWSELSRDPHAGLLDWHRRLIRLRRAEPSLTNGRLDCVVTHYDEPGRWLVVERGPVSVVCNLAAQRQKVPIRAGRHEAWLVSDPTIKMTNAGVSLPPDSVAILKWPEETSPMLTP